MVFNVKYLNASFISLKFIDEKIILKSELIGAILHKPLYANNGKLILKLKRE